CAYGEPPVSAWLAAEDSRLEQQAKALRHQHHLQSAVRAFLQRLIVREADASFGEYDRPYRPDVLEQPLSQCLAQQVDALVLYLQVIGQGAVALGYLTQDRKSVV